MARSPSVEILVHVAAPSRSTDDASYRQLAQAYLAFEPHSRTAVSLGPSDDDRENVTPGWAPVSGQQREEPPATLPSQSTVPASLDLSFHSVIDNRLSPPLRRLAPESPPSWHPPPSHVSDSYPMPDASLRHASPTRGLATHLQAFAASPRMPSQDVIDVPSSIPVPDPAHVVIPVTPGPLLRRRRPDEDEDEDDIIQVTHIPSSAASQRAESAPPSSKRARSDASAILARSRSDVGPTSTLHPADSSLEIRPPSPPAGTGAIQPSDLVSDKLAYLAHTLSTRYRPNARRALDAFERGHWRLNCSAWTREKRAEAWQFLTNYLRSGLAGWGVWCRRDAAHDWIRLYGWGHVAKHTYLLLYLASGRNIKATGAQWVGPDGQVVLEVPPVE